MMTRSVWFSMLILVGAIAGSTESVRAQCLTNGSSTLRRGTAADDASFVNSSPATADSNFKLELDLNNGLDFLEPDTEDEESASADSATAAESMDASSTDETAEAATEEIAISDAEGSSSSAADLDTVDLQAQIEMSREDYLNSRASEINDCF
ncbi:MAG: hypothetical protein F6K00_03040 [Leptolyngbya sp. SIOISBB]|nr:hypothetical protein [Leptolyngbya sp. SIOISBB]